MTLFSWVWYVLYRFWVLMIVWLTCFLCNIFLFYSLLEGFRASLQFYHITNCVFFILVEFSIVLQLFSNLFLKTPTHLKGGWLGDHALYALLKIYLNLCIKWVVWSMSYTLDPYYVFNWYHNWHLFCILIFVSIYACFIFK